MRPLYALAAAVALVALAGCSSKPTSPTGLTSVNSAVVRIRLTDAPGPFDAVNLVVNEVAIHRGLADSLGMGGMSDSLGMGGWEILSNRAATYDLMKLRNGLFATLAEGLAPAGHYTQIRLKLGAGSNVVVGGVTYPLTVPSGMQSGYKLVGEFDVPASGLMEVALDFDAARSIHQTGHGVYLLQPTCRVMPMSDVGGISGRILPDSTAASVFAISGADTVASGMPGLDGNFVLTLLRAGTYTLAVHPEAGFRDTSFVGVTVTAQQITPLGDIQLTAK